MNNSGQQAAVESDAGRVSDAPAAWIWEYIGRDAMRRHIEPCARSPHEMDPTDPPYPDTWKPVTPLYTREAVLEIAARVADAEAQRHNTGSGFDSQPSFCTAHRIADAIRALVSAT